MNAVNAVPILRGLLKDGSLTQRRLAEQCQLSLGTVNRVIKDALSNQFLERNKDDLRVTEKGLAWLETYRVENAIILAATFKFPSFPFMGTQPAGLLEVKGEVMIERQIDQLKEQGIDTIYLLAGNHLEAYDYLIDRYGIRLIYNPDYATFENFSSLYHALEHLGNSYVLMAEHYMEDNIFHDYEPESWHACVFREGPVSAWAVEVTPRGWIQNVQLGGQDCLALIGPAYVDRNTAESVKKLLQAHYLEAEMSRQYWEQVLMEHFNGLSIRARELSGIVHAFNSLDELRAFDKSYRIEAKQRVLQHFPMNECLTHDAIEEMELIFDEIGHEAYKFSVGEEEYVLRIPNGEEDACVDYAEVQSVYDLLRPLEVTEQLLSLDTETGVRIIHYYDHSSKVNPYRDRDLLDSMRLISLVHDRKLQVNNHCNTQKCYLDYQQRVNRAGGIPFRDIDEMHEKMATLLRLKERIPVDQVLCHREYIAEHVIRLSTGGLRVINWDFAGMDDPFFDVAMFCNRADFDRGRHELALAYYLGRAATKEELIRLYLSIALCGMLCTMCSLNKKRIGVNMGAFPMNKFRYAKDYYRLLEDLEPSLATGV